MVQFGGKAIRKKKFNWLMSQGVAQVIMDAKYLITMNNLQLSILLLLDDKTKFPNGKATFAQIKTTLNMNRHYLT